MAPASTRAADSISFIARDHVQLFVDYYSTGKEEKPLILLFHQAGSNRGEYAPPPTGTDNDRIAGFHRFSCVA
jgi:hypothetical protein